MEFYALRPAAHQITWVRTICYYKFAEIFSLNSADMVSEFVPCITLGSKVRNVASSLQRSLTGSFSFRSGPFGLNIVSSTR